MKKITAMLLCILLLYSATGVAASPIAIGMPAMLTMQWLPQRQTDELIAKLGQMVDIPEGWSYASANPSQRYGDAYDLNLGYDDRSVSATLLDGVLLNYSEYWQTSFGGSNAERKYPKFTKEQCKEVAEAFVKKAYANAPNGLAVSVEDVRYIGGMPTGFTYGLRAKINGIPLSTYGSINVDYTTGQVGNLYFDRSIVADYPKADRVTGADKAFETLLKHSEYRLVYMQDLSGMYNPQAAGMSGEAKLYYSPAGGAIYVDAMTGDVVDVGQIRRQYEDEMKKLSAEQGGGTNASPSMRGYYGGGSTTAPKGALSVEALEGKMRALKGTVLTDAYTLEYNDYFTNPNTGKTTAALTFVDGNKEVYASVDAMTGAVMMFNANEMYAYGTPNMSGSVALPMTGTGKLSEDECVKIAETFIQSQDAGRLDKLKRQPSSNLIGMSHAFNGNVTFTEEKDGALVVSNGVSVVVTDDGLVSAYYNSQPDDITFEDKKGVLSTDELYAKLKDGGVELCYVDFAAQYGYSLSRDKTDLRLCYVLKSGIDYGQLPILNAKTGEFVDVYGLRRIGDNIQYDDIDKSPHKTAIEKLAYIGLGYGTRKFEPNKEITQSEFVQFGIYTKVGFYSDGVIDGPWRTSESVESMAVSAGFLQKGELSADKPVTRMEAVVMLFNAHKYDKTLSASDLYTTDFADNNAIPKEYRGYAALAAKWGLIQLDGNKFQPDKVMTRGEVAEMIYAFMSK